MIHVLLGFLIASILTAGAYYASLQWVNLRHSRDILADQYKEAVEHIQELETRIALLEADKSMSEYKAKMQEDTSGWQHFNSRG